MNNTEKALFDIAMSAVAALESIGCEAVSGLSVLMADRPDPASKSSVPSFDSDEIVAMGGEPDATTERFTPIEPHSRVMACESEAVLVEPEEMFKEPEPEVETEDEADTKPVRGANAETLYSELLAAAKEGQDPDPDQVARLPKKFQKALEESISSPEEKPAELFELVAPDGTSMGEYETALEALTVLTDVLADGCSTVQEVQALMKANRAGIETWPDEVAGEAKTAAAQIIDTLRRAQEIKDKSETSETPEPESETNTDEEYCASLIMHIAAQGGMKLASDIMEKAAPGLKIVGRFDEQQRHKLVEIVKKEQAELFASFKND